MQKDICHAFSLCFKDFYDLFTMSVWNVQTNNTDFTKNE